MTGHERNKKHRLEQKQQSTSRLLWADDFLPLSKILPSPSTHLRRALPPHGATAPGVSRGRGAARLSLWVQSLGLNCDSRANCSHSLRSDSFTVLGTSIRVTTIKSPLPPPRWG